MIVPNIITTAILYTYYRQFNIIEISLSSALHFSLLKPKFSDSPFKTEWVWKSIDSKVLL